MRLGVVRPPMRCRCDRGRFMTTLPAVITLAKTVDHPVFQIGIGGNRGDYQVRLGASGFQRIRDRKPCVARRHCARVPGTVPGLG